MRLAAPPAAGGRSPASGERGWAASAPGAPAVNAVRLVFGAMRRVMVAAGYGTQRTIGIDVGGTKILAGVVERDGTVVRTERRDTPVESTEAFLTGLAEVVDGLRDDSVAAVGIGIPSTIDQREGTSVFAVTFRSRGSRCESEPSSTWGCPSRSTTTRMPLQWPSGRSAPAAARST